METATGAAPRLDAKQLLAPFVGRNDIRTWMNEPLSIRGDLVACNGYILVCVVGAGLDTAPNPKMPITMLDLHAAGTDRVWGDALVAVDSIQPVLVDLRDVKCVNCKGRGRVVVQHCDECDRGTFVHGSHEYRRLECDGTGANISAGDDDDDECPKCHGSGVNGGIGSTIVDGRLSVQYHFIKQMQSLPECFIEAKAHHEQYACPAHGLFYFRFRGGWGLVMSYRG